MNEMKYNMQLIAFTIWSNKFGEHENQSMLINYMYIYASIERAMSKGKKLYRSKYHVENAEKRKTG